jgi:hypothetical protein
MTFAEADRSGDLFAIAKQRLRQIKRPDLRADGTDRQLMERNRLIGEIVREMGISPRSRRSAPRERDH